MSARFLRKRRTLKTSAIARRRRKVFFIKVILVLLLCVLVVFGVSRLFSSKSLTIQNIEISGNQSVSAQDLRQTVLRDLQGSYWFIIPKKSIFFYPKKKIARDVLNTYPRILKLEIHRAGLHQIALSLTERKAAFSWCGLSLPEGNAEIGSNQTSQAADGAALASETSASSTGDTPALVVDVPEQCYLLDGNGYLFADESASSTAKYLKFYGPLFHQSAAPNASSTASTTPDTASPLGSSFLGAGNFAKLISVVNGLQENDIAVTYALWDGKDKISLGTESGYQVWFSVTQNPTEVIENFKAVLASDAFRGTSGQKELQSLEYIDLRFGNRVFYK
ncbi:MAG TPA: FtsQ-type POTRA domain-containing protein [Candidatus Paceibacterota bacterium]|nr:FtsQ-type POTRA domain-containing protein [Candidatus Paceibacterota bacterium]